MDLEQQLKRVDDTGDRANQKDNDPTGSFFFFELNYRIIRVNQSRRRLLLSIVT